MSYAPLSTDHLIQALRILGKNKYSTDGYLESWISLAAERLEELTADRDLYKKKYTAAIDACWFMHKDPAFKSLPLGSELPVAGVVELKRQRDEYRSIAREVGSWFLDLTLAVLTTDFVPNDIKLKAYAYHRRIVKSYRERLDIKSTWELKNNTTDWAIDYHASENTPHQRLEKLEGGK